MQEWTAENVELYVQAPHTSVALLDTFVTPGYTFLANPTPGSALCDNIILGETSITVIDYNISFKHYGKQIIHADHNVECACKHWHPTGFLGVHSNLI